MKKSIRHSMAFLLFSFALICITLKVSGQNTLTEISKKNSLNLEIASLKFISTTSLNYERLLLDSKKFKMLINTGVGGWYFSNISKSYYGLSFPLSINNILGKNNNYFEVDLGIRYTSFSKHSDKDLSALFPIFNIGYRHQSIDGKGLIFRTFLGTSGVGIAIGKAF